MKKVLYVATVDSHINAFHLPYLKLLHDNGYEVHVATNGNASFPCCDVKNQIPIERSPFKLRNIKAINELKKIIETERFDLIHCHTPMGGVVTRLAAKRARKKYGTRVIYTAHGFHFYKGAPLLNWLLFYPIEKYLAKYTDTLITINTEDYELARKKFSKKCHDIQFVPGVGIDLNKFNIEMTDKEKNIFRKSLGLKNNDFILVCVARLDKNKNQEFLINCMKKLIKINNNAHLLLVGSDELNGYYQNIVSKDGLNNNIHFLGRREDIPKILQISDIVVSASKREGLGVNIIEALASGKPVVASNNRGHRDIVVNGKNGYLCEYDLNLFVERINQIHNNKLLNLKESVAKYDIKNIIDNISAIYCLEINNEKSIENKKMV